MSYVTLNKNFGSQEPHRVGLIDVLLKNKNWSSKSLEIFQQPFFFGNQKFDF